jgi:signal transduction histidine kinase
VTDELRRLRAQLSSLQSLLTLSKLMGDSGDQLRIAHLAGTAVPSLARCQLVGVELAGGGWGLVGPAGGSAAVLREVAGALQRLGRHGGAVASPEMAPGWVWAYPMQSAAGHVGFLVVAAAAEPPAEERFVLQSLAQQTGVALINARLQADERAAAAAALEAKREADRANTAKSEFLSRMSHELRTPLNAILGFGQLLQLDDLAEEQAESVDHILRAGQHLLGLINEVLDLARIESGHLALSPEAVGVFEVIKDTVDLIGPLATERALRIHAPSPPECAWIVQADRQRLKQVLLNLASNAVKYNHHGGSISLTCHAGDDGRVRIAVADTGPGIPADKLPRLFTQFDRLGAEHSEIQGTGIGLVLAKRLAEAMGGALTVASVEGQGTTFTLELSLAMEPA